MLSNRAKRILAVSLAVSFALMAVSPLFATAATIPGGAKTGPYIEKFILDNMAQDLEPLALLNDQIDLIGEMVDAQYLPILQEAENVNVESTPRNGYGFITIKCDKYPFNITNFRRALAFAIDKYYISDVIQSGLSQTQDSCVPAINPFSIEGMMPYTYYESNMPLANQMLNESGFFDVNSDGWREAPNGELFTPEVAASPSAAIAVASGTYCVQVLRDLKINAVLNLEDFNTYIANVYAHQDYDILFHGIGFNSFDVGDWLGYWFWSEYADEYMQNEPCWRNATYDSWRDQLLHSTNYTEVLEAAYEMQKIWIHASPMIIFYENTLLNAYRTDKFEGTVNSISGVPDWWTNQKVHLKLSQGGPFGGDYRWSLPQAIQGFNLFTTSTAYSWYVLDELYDSMIIVDAKGDDVPWLASSWEVLTHADDDSVPDGHTRITFDLIQNATWTDGMPLTAEDVAFSLNFFRDADGQQFQSYMLEMVAAYAKTPYQVVVEFSTESYWHLHAAGFEPILPKHWFLEMGITTTNWNTWNPQPPTDEMVTSGPFNVTNYVPGEFVEMTYNPHYFYGIAHTLPTTTTTVVGPDLTMAIVAGAVGAAVVILVGGYVLMRQK